MGCGRSWRGQKLLSILDLTPIAFWHRRLAIKLEMVALFAEADSRVAGGGYQWVSTRSSHVSVYWVCDCAGAQFWGSFEFIKLLHV